MAIIDKQILVDCGEGTVKALFQNQIDFQGLKAVFLTHMHSDHAIGVVALICQYAYYNQVLDSLPIYVPEGMKIHLEGLLDHTFHTFNTVNFKPEIVELPLDCQEPLVLTFEDKTYSITWTESIHKPLCYAFRFNDNIVFTGDTAKCEKIAQLASGVQYLVHEGTFPDSMADQTHRVNHSTPSEAAEIATQAGVQALRLYHLPDLSVDMEDEYLADARAIFSPIEILHDNDKIII